MENKVRCRERVKKYGEVFTPEWVVKMMCDQLEESSGEDPFSAEKTILEPSCGTGNFLVEILSRKLARCSADGECLTALKSIYGIDILPDNVAEAKKRMLQIFVEHCGHTAEARRILDRNILSGDALKLMADLGAGGDWPGGG